MGLIEAANRFDPERGFKFDSYAIWWIRRYIIFDLARVGRIVKVPAASAGISMAMRDKIRELQQTLQREPTEEEIANSIRISEKMVRVIENTNNIVSLNAVIGEDDVEHIDYLTYSKEPDTIDKELIKATLFDRLNQRERELISDYYLNNMNLDDIGKRIGLSRERVRQIINKALIKLRRTIKKDEVYA